MFIMHGKYNIARIFLPNEDQLEETTKEQIQSFLNNPAFSGRPICIMPDCHAGKGAVVGFTFPINNYIVPNVVGVDIGCGVNVYSLGTSLPTDNFNEIDKVIRKVVPIGFNIHQNHYYWKDRLTIETPILPQEIDILAYEINKVDKVGDFRNALGTLGGGNHFIEIGKGDSGNYYLTVHTGSRNLGLQVANYYQGLAKELQHLVFCESTELDSLPIGILGNYDGTNYLKSMKVAQRYAQTNRKIIIYEILNALGMEFDEELMIESIHNYIGNDYIIRKGAISANAGERVIIPFNMEDGLILGYGKGNPEWNYSAPHGAGRILSRNKAKKELNLENAKSEMKNAGVFTTSLNESTLDEAKGAYKNKDMIIEAIKETVEITEFVKPIYNLKAGE